MLLLPRHRARATVVVLTIMAGVRDVRLLVKLMMGMRTALIL